MQFKNKSNGYIETKSHPLLWTFLFGGFYFILSGVWTHIILWFVISIFLFSSLGPSATILVFVMNFVYMLAAESIIRNQYLRKGWIEIEEEKEEPKPQTTLNFSAQLDLGKNEAKKRSAIPEEKTCPFCAESIKYKALICKHCGRDQPPI